MAASRMYWSSILASLRTFSAFLLGFIIFSIVVGLLSNGSGPFNAVQVPVDRTTAYNVTSPYIVNGTMYYNTTTVYNTTIAYVDDCDGHQCGWWLQRLVVLLEVIALSLFTLAFALASIGGATQESMLTRGDNTTGAGTTVGSYLAVEVVATPFTLLVSLICVVLGILSILASVLVQIWIATGKHNWTFIASVIILSIFAILAVLFLFAVLFRSEAPIVVQPVYAAVPVGVSGPYNVNDIHAQPRTEIVTEYEMAPQDVQMDTLGRRFSNSVAAGLRRLSGGGRSPYSPLRARGINPNVMS